MSLPTITPAQAKRLLEGGSILIDIREADEYARENIPGARHVPLSELDQADLAAQPGQTVIFHCRSGARTRNHGARLAARAGRAGEVVLMDGGLDAWRKAGLPTSVERSQPGGLLRQVQIAAGGLILLGTLLGMAATLWFYAVPLSVKSGLLLAVLAGCYGMARLLQRAS